MARPCGDCGRSLRGVAGFNCSFGMALGMVMDRILVVEDDPSIAELIAWALGDTGFVVWTAPNVKEALRLYTQVSPNLIVADFLLPDGLGSDLVRQIRAYDGHNRTAALLMSAHPRADEQALAAGINACLQKPFDLDVLFATIEKLLAHTGSISLSAGGDG